MRGMVVFCHKGEIWNKNDIRDRFFETNGGRKPGKFCFFVALILVARPTLDFHCYYLFTFRGFFLIFASIKRHAKMPPALSDDDTVGHATPRQDWVQFSISPSTVNSSIGRSRTRALQQTTLYSDNSHTFSSTIFHSSPSTSRILRTIATVNPAAALSVAKTRGGNEKVYAYSPEVHADFVNWAQTTAFYKKHCKSPRSISRYQAIWDLSQLQSTVWKNFELGATMQNGNPAVICKTCLKLLAHPLFPKRNGTSSLARHLNTEDHKAAIRNKALVQAANMEQLQLVCIMGHIL
jgi:hypothetical protein